MSIRLLYLGALGLQEIELQLELRLSLESKEIADYNGATSEFTVSVRVLMNLTSGHMTNPLLFPKFQVLYPVALTAAIFSMQQEAIPFHLNRRSFALAV